ncbi:MAG: hypothetical protein QOG92_1942 [Verrucomicrobiota bacterium]|nr:hypothetical protein [Verrucomicrobiota bacterium]
MPVKGSKVNPPRKGTQSGEHRFESVVKAKGRAILQLLNSCNSFPNHIVLNCR